MNDSLDAIQLDSEKHLKGNERFSYKGTVYEMSMLDYWRWHYSEIYDLQDTIAEYIVCKALGMKSAHNVGSWTLYDALYKGKRIEVKETSYFHAWQTDEKPKSNARVFSISKAYSTYKDNSSEFVRQNDIYVFCLNTGMTRESSNPLMLENWEFYIIPTRMINAVCKDSKTISLSRVRKMTEKVDYPDIKSKIDAIIESENEQ